MRALVIAVTLLGLGLGLLFLLRGSDPRGADPRLTTEEERPREAPTPAPETVLPPPREDAPEAALQTGEARVELRAPAAAAEAPAAERAPSFPRLRVRLVDEVHQPLAGGWARVRLRERELRVEGDARGEVVLALDPSWTGSTSRVRLEASAPGRILRHADVETSLLSTTSEFFLGELVLSPGGVLSGRVLDPGGTPVAGARVVARPPTSAPSAMERVFLPHSWFGLGVSIAGITEPDGTYRLEGVPCVAVEVLAADPVNLVACSPSVEVLPEGETRVPDLVLARPGDGDRITGRVLEASGEPCDGFLVRLLSEDGNAVYPSNACTDATGAFALLAAAKLEYLLVASDPARRREVRLPGIRAGVRDVRLVFSIERTIAVTVRNEAGPVAGARAVAENEQRRGLKLTVAEEPGRLSVPVPDQTFWLSVSAPAHRAQRLGPFEPDAPPATLDVQMERLGGVSGVVRLGPRGLEGVPVHAHAEIEGPFGRDSAELVSFVEPNSLAGTTTEEGGRYFLPLAASGRFCLHATPPGQATAQAWVRFTDGAVVDEVELVVPEAGRLSGALLVADGVEPRGVWIAATDGQGHVELCQTDTSGAYRFEALTPGSWQVLRIPKSEAGELRRSQRNVWPAEEGEVPPPWSVVVPAGGEARFDIDVRDEVPCVLEGRLALGGAGASGLVAVLNQESAALDADGRFVLRAPRAGRYWLWIGAATPDVLARGVFTTQIDLEGATTRWELDVPVGELEIANLPPVPPDPRQGQENWSEYALLWSQGEVRWCASFQETDAHELHARNVPAGSLVLRWRGEGAHPQDEENWPKLLDLGLTAGELQSVRLP